MFGESGLSVFIKTGKRGVEAGLRFCLQFGRLNVYIILID